MNDSNLGRFKIEERWVRDEPEKVAEVFAILKCVPVRAEMLFAEQRIEYTAIAERFPEVPIGNLIPEYTLTIESDGEGWPSCVIVQNIESEVRNEQGE